ncbi:hypothetical protein [Bacillus toyonensis]|uniref:hypothetical protein n=1 Tax=Bacillus toyonensis TaxID=155322 RepID=UPI000BF048B1|nr:hypothetical protein [Bacillus toyonensis]PEO28680.1 hypothetical protein CN589_13995 [Bacillus toyonensis]PFY01388.1 hypothetical protein COL45_17650 [Bacillus toyonensis]PHB83471.1 hypothetical protein COE93_04140 [Bacillus toyonensis]
MYWEKQKLPVYSDCFCPYNSNPSDLRFNLTGAWLCNDGGAYFIRHIVQGDWHRVWWLGLSQRGLGDHFTNVFEGQLARPDWIYGIWADVPRGNARSSGHLNIYVKDNGRKLTLWNETGGFGGSVWTRL